MLNTYNITLADTIPYMNSKDYKERFIGEYWQTKIRYDKLHSMLVKYEADTLDFEPSCSFDLLQEQAKYMGMYLNKLEIRAAIEDIDLETPLKVNGTGSIYSLSTDKDIAQLSIEDLREMTTSPCTEGCIEEKEITEDEEEPDFTFEEMCTYFRVGQRVIHDVLGCGKITSMWYDLDGKGNILTMDIEWDNGATVILDSLNPHHKKILSELITG